MNQAALSSLRAQKRLHRALRSQWKRGAPNALYVQVPIVPTPILDKVHHRVLPSGSETRRIR
jgi:hypothetical protein